MYNVETPEISRFLGMVIAMYHREHPPPPFHVHYGEFEAQVQIDPPGWLHGELPPRALAMVVAWAVLHRQELMNNWERTRRRESAQRIEGL
jgi:hypothetical protein